MTQKNQRHYERLLLAEVRRFQNLLYLRDWTFYIRFDGEDGATKLLSDEAGEVARIELHGYIHRGDIRVTPLLKPELYAWAVAHEVLHARLWVSELIVRDYNGAIGKAVYDQTHADLDFIARALSGTMMPSDGNYCLPRPPWVRG